MKNIQFTDEYKRRGTKVQLLFNFERDNKKLFGRMYIDTKDFTCDNIHLWENKEPFSDEEKESIIQASKTCNPMLRALEVINSKK